MRHWWAMALLIGGCVLLVCVDTTRSLQERAALLAENRVVTLNLAGSLAQQVQDALRSTEALLAGFVERIEIDGLDAPQRDRLRRLEASRPLPPWLGGFYAVGPDGIPVINPGAGTAAPVSVADRPYFVYHRTHADRGMHIGASVRNRTTQRWVIPVSRRLDHPDGSFAGVAVAVVDIGAFEKLYDAVTLGDRGVVNVLLADGTLLIRHPFIEAAIGHSFAGFPPFDGATPEPFDFLDITSPFDGIRRLVTYRRMFDDRLVLVIGQEREAVLGPWRRQAIGHFVGIALLSIGLAALGSWLLALTRRAHRRDLAEARLNAEHRVLAEHTSEMVFRAGRDGERLYVSPACKRLLGFRPDELLGLRTVDCVHPDDLPSLADTWERAKDGPIMLTYRMRRKDGTFMWAEASSQIVPGTTGPHPECLVVVRDIGLRMEAQHRLRESEARHRLLSEHASDMIFRLDLDFVRRDVSPACFEILGYRPEELIGTRPIGMIHPGDAAHVAGVYRALAQGQERATLTNRIRHRDGHWVWVEVQLRLLRDEAGQPEGIIGVMRDISRRRAAEEREAAAMARLQATHDMLLQAEAMTHIGHWRLLIASQEVTWSDEVYRIYGWPRTQIPSLATAIEGYHEDDRARVQALVERAISAGQPFRFDLRIVRPDGDLRYVTSHGQPEFDSSGQLVAVIGTFQDVTERTLLEQELRQAQKMKTIGRLAAGVAHDFNNLLQAMTGSLELIRDGVEPGSPLLEYARIALAAAERGGQMSHHLLSYARRQVLRPRPLSAGPLLADMQVLLARTLGPHISVETKVAGDLPDIQVDPAHLQTALLNLGINAGQAMPGGGTLTLEAWVETGGEAGPAPMVVVAVADTGIGMEAATVAQACEPFFTTKGLKGTGLGLSMVQGFARQSGGDVRIMSEPAHGTRVELRLPAVRGPTAAPAQAVAGEVVEACRVLLVDDVADVLITTAAFLEGGGIEVVAAASGEAALALLSKGERFDALVTDYAMPDLDGVALIRCSRAIQPHLPAVVITGYAGVEDADGLPPGTEVLRKPFGRRGLLDAVARARTGAGHPGGGHPGAGHASASGQLPGGQPGVPSGDEPGDGWPVSVGTLT